jgi:hypothetical protein
MRGGAQLLFDEIDANLSGHVTREEARSGLAALGLSVSDDVAIDVVDAISVDQTEHINRVEFEAWLRRDVSKHMVRPCFALIANHHTNLSKRSEQALLLCAQMALVVAKVLIGLGQ